MRYKSILAELIICCCFSVVATAALAQETLSFIVLNGTEVRCYPDSVVRIEITPNTDFDFSLIIVDWGDGVVQQINPGEPLILEHAYPVAQFLDDCTYDMCLAEQGFCFQLEIGASYDGTDAENISKRIIFKFPPRVNYDIEPSYINPGVEVSMLNSTCPENDNSMSYFWTFPDGSTSTEKEPTYSFDSIGVYPVTLTATNECDATTANRNVTVQPLGGTGASEGAFILDTAAAVLVNDTFKVPVKLLEFSSITSFQLSIQTTEEPLVQPGVGFENTFDSQYTQSLNTTSILWYEGGGGTVDSGDSTTVFYLLWPVSSLNDTCILSEFVDMPLPALVVDDTRAEVVPSLVGGVACLPQDVLEIYGQVTTVAGEAIPGIPVLTNLDTTLWTDQQGAFGIGGLAAGGNYVLEPIIDGAYLNGVNVVDLVYIRDHLLGGDVFEDPLERVAADVDGNKQLQLIDLLQIRDLIVGFRDSLIVGSWQAVYHQPPLMLPSQNNSVPEFETALVVDGLSESIDNADFVAVKSGDVNRSVDIDDEFSFLVMPDQAFRAGEIVVLRLSPSQSQPIDGAQFSLRYDPQFLHPVVATSKSSNDSDYSRIYKKEEGLLNLIWLPENADTSGVMLTFTALKKGYASRSIHLDNSEAALLPIAVRSGSVHPLAVVPAISPASSSAHLQIMACYPNPFDGEITITLNSGKSEIVTVEIVDLVGRTHYREQRYLARGQYDWHIPAAGRIPSVSAVYFLKVQSDSGEQTVKLFRK